MFGPTSTCPWSAVTSSTAPGGQRLEHVADEAVGGAQLGVVELAEATLVGDLVDAAVVGVHEALAGGELAADLDRRSPTRPASRPARPAQVGLGERRRLQLGRADHRHRRGRGTPGTAARRRADAARRRSSPVPSTAAR